MLSFVYEEAVTRGWTLAEVAERGGVSESRLIKLCTAINPPSLEECAVLEKAFEIDAGYWRKLAVRHFQYVCQVAIGRLANDGRETND